MTLVKSLAARGIGAFWSIFVIPKLAYDVIRHPLAFFGAKKRENRPNCLDDPELGTHGFIRIEGMRYHYVANGPEDKPLMLLVHGFPECWYSWRYQLKEFKKDYRVVAIDNRGYGETDKPPNVSDYQMSYLVGDIEKLVNAFGYKSCILVGHDWGAAIAWAVASKFPSIVDKLIIMNVPHGKAFAKHLATSRSQFLKSWYIYFFQLPWMPELSLWANDYAFIESCFVGKNGGLRHSKMSADDVEAIKYSMSGSLTSSINYYRATIRYLVDKSYYGAIHDVPVLVIWGDQDMALDTEMAAMSGDHVKDFTLKYVEGASHWVQQDDPQIVNQIMRDFFNSRTNISKL